jgi:hypothetical protein
MRLQGTTPSSSVVHGYFLRLFNSLLCGVHPRRFENPRFLDVVFRNRNNPKISLNVNLLTSHGFCSRIHAPRSRTHVDAVTHSTTDSR